MKKVIKLEQVKRVYSGKPGCACGCRGNYSETSRSFKLMLKKYNDAPEDHINTTDRTSVGDDWNFVFWDNEDRTRTYTIYFKE